MTALQLRPHIHAARTRLAEGLDELRRRHDAGASGREISAALADLRDGVLGSVFAAVHAHEATDQIALVAHGGHGRRDVAPFSDVDLMVLRRSDTDAEVAAAKLSERLLADVFDAGLELGHSVRTIEEACRLGLEDGTIATSLLEARFLLGSRKLFDEFWARYASLAGRRCVAMIRLIDQARAEERLKYGETVFLLEPNVKRSRGTLRDLQLIRWIGQVRYAMRESPELVAAGHLSPDDAEAMERAWEFLLWVRNELHFRAGKSGDVLTRAEQVRIAEKLGYRPAAGMLPVEQFMRDYFRHTEATSNLAVRFLNKARAAPRWKKFWAALLGRRVEGDLLASPTEILARGPALKRLDNLAEILRLARVADLYDKQLAPETWEAIRAAAPALPARFPPEAAEQFLRLLEHPGRLGEALRGLHQTGVLERAIPHFIHARGLLQFNQYHKYTVDEHCLRAVERATEFETEPGPLGRAYRAIREKAVLHLALLIHDLGKGYPEDHSEVGRRIAVETAARLGLDEERTEDLVFLVHRHLLMNQAALQRDTGEEQTVVRFAADVGSPELLQMLYVFTAADLAAVGPDTWTSWKGEVLTDLFHRAMQYLAGESPGTSRQEHLDSRREAVRRLLRQDKPTARLIDSLPAPYLGTTDPEQIAEDLGMLRRLGPADIDAQGRYLPETQTVRFTVGTTEKVAAGIFHKLTGALTSQGLEILSAQIYTLADGLVLDRFWVCDPDYAGEPPPERLERVNAALVDSLRCDRPPKFRKLWTPGAAPPAVPPSQVRVRIDNHTSDSFTMIDVIAPDRRGLLYAITRELFELGYSVWRAKIGTHLDQVVDVFYVTDGEGKKVDDAARLHETRRRLFEVIDKSEA